MVANGLDTRLLFNEAFIVLHHLVVLLTLVVANVQEVFLQFKHLFLLNELVTEFDHVLACLFDVMESNCESDDLQLLLLDAGLIEQSLLVKREELLLELGLDLLDFVFDVLELDQPLLALLFTRVFHALLKLLQTLLLVFTHFFLRLVHPLFTNELVIELALLLLED